MTSNTKPWGEVKASSVHPGRQAYYAFNGSTPDYGSETTFWYTANAGEQWIQYDFKRSVRIKKYIFNVFTDGENKTVQLVGSKDGVAWFDLENEKHTVNESSISGRNYEFDIGVKNEARYIRIKATHGSGGVAIGAIQFYGLDYSEREFEEGSTMKYLYDHGVELEPLVGFKNQNGDLVDTDSYEYLYMEKKVTAAGNVAVRTVSQIDLTNYSLMRAKVGNIFVGGNNAIFVINLQTPNTADAAIAASGFNANNLPDNNALDLSNINQSLYCDVGLVESNTVTRKQSITEWWLE